MAHSVSATGVSSRQSSLDVLKCVAAFFVVWIHFGAPVPNTLVRTAVPIFFMISGYYYPSLIEHDRFWKHFQKLVKITLFTFVLYAAGALVEGEDWTANVLSARWIAGCILSGNDIFYPYSGHLWFFYAMLFDLIVFKLADHYGATRYLKYASPWLLTIFLWSIYAGCPFHFRNGLFFGLPCMMIGRCIREGDDRHIAFLAHKHWGWAYALLSFALICADYAVFLDTLGTERDMYLFTLPLAIAIFYKALQHPTFGEGSLVARIGQKDSSNIFIVHLMVGYCLSDVFPQNSLKPYLLPFLIFALSLLLSIVWRAAWRKVRWNG